MASSQLGSTSAPSVASCATTCFDGSTEPRYEDLRNDRKAISDQVSRMVNGRKPFEQMTKVQLMSTDIPIELFDQAQDIDSLRLDIAHNVRNWIEKAHDTLDVNADVDRRMLGKMAEYVERVRRYLIRYPFLVDEDPEMEAQALNLPTRMEILPPKAKGKRARDESVPRLNFTPPPTKNLMKPNIVTHEIVEDVFLSSNENVANQTAFFIPTPTQRLSSTSTPRVENPQGAEGGARPKRRASGFATASPDSLAHNQIQINLRNLEKAKAASDESNEELKKLQLVVENRRKEVEENQRRKTAKLNEKIERQRLEREEKKRVEEMRKRQEEVEKTNAAVMSELAAKKISDQECQRMIQILKDLNMKDDQQIDEDEVQIEKVTSGDTDGFITANRRRKSAKNSPTKMSQEPIRHGQDQGKQGYQNFIMNRQNQQKIANQRKGKPVDYQEGCGLQCASRGPHTHQ